MFLRTYLSDFVFFGSFSILQATARPDFRQVGSELFFLGFNGCEKVLQAVFER